MMGPKVENRERGQLHKRANLSQILIEKGICEHLMQYVGYSLLRLKLKVPEGVNTR